MKPIFTEKLREKIRKSVQVSMDDLKHVSMRVKITEISSSGVTLRVILYDDRKNEPLMYLDSPPMCLDQTLTVAEIDAMFAVELT